MIFGLISIEIELLSYTLLLFKLSPMKHISNFNNLDNYKIIHIYFTFYIFDFDISLESNNANPLLKAKITAKCFNKLGFFDKITNPLQLIKIYFFSYSYFSKILMILYKYLHLLFN